MGHQDRRFSAKAVSVALSGLLTVDRSSVCIPGAEEKVDDDS
jgi:hypothetical protein